MPRDFAQNVVQSARGLIAEDMPAEARHDLLVDYLRSWLSADELVEMANAAVAAAASGGPRPVFLDMRTEAESWAALASQDELAIYAWAAAQRLPLERRAGLAGVVLKDLAHRSPPAVQAALRQAVVGLRDALTTRETEGCDGRSSV